MGSPRRRPPPPPPPLPASRSAPKPVQVMTPTASEVDQSGDAYAVRTKRRGRSQTILTGPRGSTRRSKLYTRSKKFIRKINGTNRFNKRFTEKV